MAARRGRKKEKRERKKGRREGRGGVAVEEAGAAGPGGEAVKGSGSRERRGSRRRPVISKIGRAHV